MSLYAHIPESPGVYFMKDVRGRILYIGKAVNLKRRVSGYFSRPHDVRITRLISMVRKIDYTHTDSALEALILEASLIKKHQPPFNVREKDDKSFFYVTITKDEFPRVLLVRGRGLSEEKDNFAEVFGPFTSSSSLKEALRIMRKIFPWSVHNPSKKQGKACFDYHIGLCPGTCIGIADKREYRKNIKNLSFFFSGKRNKVIKNLERAMTHASKKLEFEKAQKIKKQLFALQHINDVAVISDDNLKFNPPAACLPAKRERAGNSKLKIPARRVEGYDISNISGKHAVGSMVVFIEDVPEKSEYRKFSISAIESPDDTGMMKEMLERRFKHSEWTFPDLILVDGGIGQVNAAMDVLKKQNIIIPVIGMVKGKKRKRSDIIGDIPPWTTHRTLVRVRDEAHRVSIQYHRTRRKNSFLPKR